MSPSEAVLSEVYMFRNALTVSEHGHVSFDDVGYLTYYIFVISYGISIATAAMESPLGVMGSRRL